MSNLVDPYIIVYRDAGVRRFGDSPFIRIHLDECFHALNRRKASRKSFQRKGVSKCHS